MRINSGTGTRSDIVTYATIHQTNLMYQVGLMYRTFARLAVVRRWRIRGLKDTGMRNLPFHGRTVSKVICAVLTVRKSFLISWRRRLAISSGDATGAMVTRRTT